MGLGADVTWAIVVTFMALVFVYLGVTVVEDTGQFVKDNDADISIYSGTDVINKTNEVIWFWGPALMTTGAWVIVAARAYTRQRTEVQRTRRI
jgi:hypothetical protein